MKSCICCSTASPCPAKVPLNRLLGQLPVSAVPAAAPCRKPKPLHAAQPPLAAAHPQQQPAAAAAPVRFQLVCKPHHQQQLLRCWCHCTAIPTAGRSTSCYGCHQGEVQQHADNTQCPAVASAAAVARPHTLPGTHRCRQHDQHRSQMSCPPCRCCCRPGAAAGTSTSSETGLCSGLMTINGCSKASSHRLATVEQLLTKRPLAGLSSKLECCCRWRCTLLLLLLLVRCSRGAATAATCCCWK